MTLGLLIVAVAAGPASARDVRLVPSGTLLRAPSTTPTVTVTPATGCQSLLRTGTGDCGVVHAAGGDLVFTVEAGPVAQDGLVSRPWTVTIYRAAPSVPNGWQAALVTRAPGSDPAALYANVTAKPADLTGDGHQSLVIGYRAEGTGEILDLDIVVGTPKGPRVAVHSQFYRGVIQIAPGHLVTYVPIYRTRDGNCCPSFTERDEIRNRKGRFVLTTGPRFPTRTVDIPPGDLG
ncbi:MAG TPA: hypothetical protein VLV81_02915 [Acidimicrobiia bacterium]|nr:hypothetical protein [Acidimicrobiia bacterium]